MALYRESSAKCTSAGRVTASLLLSFLALSTPIAASISKSGHLDQQPIPILSPLPTEPEVQNSLNNEHVFTLRHIFHHGTYTHPNLHKKKDVRNPEAPLWLLSEDGFKEELTTSLVARSQSLDIQRLVDRRPSVVEPMVAAARENGEVWVLSSSAWTVDTMAGPNVTDKPTILTFAHMAANAYVEEPNTGDWEDVHGGFNNTKDFGWENDGLRGHIYADENNSTIVIGLKGTSLAIFDGEKTTTNDKENDNLFFSCCCAQQGSYMWRQVCDCATGTYTCNSTCLAKSLKKENRYYKAALHLYSNVTAIYPNSDVWMSGHSLGGSVSAMLGLTYGLPTITFQAVPDALPAGRLGLPVPPGSDPERPHQRADTGASHFGHTADPIYMGTCNGATASCSWAGYALESACHTGRECVYDVVGDLGWRVGIATHRILGVIRDVIKKYDTVPECKFTPECSDCPLWKQVESNGTGSTTSSRSSTSTKTRTRTSTCQTPGWWGCLDETTTSTISTSTSLTSTSTSTSSCKTPGWFGCNDETTTSKSRSHTATSTKISTTTSSSTTSSSSTTCHSPGFFGGCNDPISSTTTSLPTSSDCKTPGLFWGCNDKSTTQTHSHTITSPPTMPSSAATTTPTKTQNYECTSSAWFGLICVDPSPTATHSHCVQRN